MKRFFRTLFAFLSLEASVVWKYLKKFLVGLLVSIIGFVVTLLFGLVFVLVIWILPIIIVPFLKGCFFIACFGCIWCLCYFVIQAVTAGYRVFANQTKRKWDIARAKISDEEGKKFKEYVESMSDRGM